MALSLADLKSHVNVGGSADDALLTRLLAVAQAKIERHLGFALGDTDDLPDGAPADLEHAVYMLAAHLYENREATLVGVSMQVLPLGVTDIVSNYRRYTFGHVDEVSNDGG